MAQEAIRYVAILRPAKWKISKDNAHAIELPWSKGTYLSEQRQRKLRDRFLAIEKGDEGALLSFLNETGVWQRWKRIVPVAEFWQHQTTLAFLLTNRKPKEHTETRVWTENKLSNVLTESLYIRSIYRAPWLKLPATIEFGVDETRGALYLSVWRDRFHKAEFRYCARVDCADHGAFKVPFEVTRRDKEYCSQYCAHLVSLRKKRARKQRRP